MKVVDANLEINEYKNEYSELPTKITAPTMDMHRAIISLSTKLAGLDHHNQRIDACTDRSLLSILTASREVEKQHIARLLEWIRRHDPQFDHALRATLFKAGPIASEDV